MSLKQEQMSAHGPRKIYFSPVLIIYWNRFVLVLSINSFNVVISLIKQDFIFKFSISSKFILLENKTKILSKILHDLCSSFFLVHAIFHAMIFGLNLWTLLRPAETQLQKNEITQLVRQEMEMMNCTSKTEYICETRIDDFSLENETFAYSVLLENNTQ